MEFDKNDKGPEFTAPVATPSGDALMAEGEISLRNYIATRVMQGDWAAQSEFTGEWANSTSDKYLMERARLYYRMADAMIKVSKE